MLYSIVGILAIVIHLIVNIDAFLNIKRNKRFPGEGYYLCFILSVIAFHITDGFWGILYDNKQALAVTIDTDFYFITMAVSILFWVLFVYRYLGVNRRFSKSIVITGVVVLVFQLISVTINFFHPVLFEVTSDCVYSAKPFRYVMLAIQILMFLLVAAYTLLAMAKQEIHLRRRYLTVGLFSLFMMVAIILQVFFPLYPLYSLGYLLGICVLHSFVVEVEIASQRLELESIKEQMRFDPLTGVLSKHAYVDCEAAIEEKIRNDKIDCFAVVIFDVNNLKHVNDTLGHSTGDKYLESSAALIKKFYQGVPIYRVGGDEFAAILEGEHYEKRDEYFTAFNKTIDKNLKGDGIIIISAGMAAYDKNIDNTFLQVFARADKEMYARKSILKSRGS